MVTELNKLETFRDWLNKELNTRGWSYGELARRGAISRSSISLFMSGRRPGEKVLNGIAQALGEPREYIFNLAGRFPHIIGNNKSEEKQLLDYFRHLATQDRHSVLTLARALHEEHAQYETNKVKS